MAVWNPRANEIFAEVLDLPPAEQETRAAELCAGDAELLRQVQALLRAHRDAGPSFLGAPPADPEAQTAVKPPDGTGARPDAPGQAEAIPPGLLQPPGGRPGSMGRLSHYEVLEVIGRGGMGTVVKAFDEKLHRVVAIKIMSDQM